MIIHSALSWDDTRIGRTMCACMLSCIDAGHGWLRRDMGLNMQSLSGAPDADSVMDSGEASLNKLGYKQEPSRGFTFGSNAAMFFRCC